MRQRLLNQCVLVAMSLIACLLCGVPISLDAQASNANVVYNPDLFQALEYRLVGPHRGGRVTRYATPSGTP